MIYIYPAAHYVPYWIALRCVNKIIRHLYNAYLCMDLRFEKYAVEWVRTSSFYVIYTLEYIVSLLLVIQTIAHLRREPIRLPASATPLNVAFDYMIVLLYFMCVSTPYFLNTVVYLHRKREQMLYFAKLHQDDDDDE